jgi:hypothetical protein
MKYICRIAGLLSVKGPLTRAPVVLTDEKIIATTGQRNLYRLPFQHIFGLPQC